MKSISMPTRTGNGFIVESFDMMYWAQKKKEIQISKQNTTPWSEENIVLNTLVYQDWICKPMIQTHGCKPMDANPLQIRGCKPPTHQNAKQSLAHRRENLIAGLWFIGEFDRIRTRVRRVAAIMMRCRHCLLDY
jgi:hypothetical protein